VVDAGLSSPADPAVFAIGDCAQPPEGSAGLIAQGWDQARRLAVALVAGRPVTAPAPTDGEVVKLKAHGVDAVAMGSAGPARVPGDRALQLTDPHVGRHVEVVVRDGVLVGAVCVGDGALAADLVSTYTRGTPVPRDPAHLLLRPVAGAGAAEASSPTLMPDRATVCRCNGVSKGDVVGCWRAGATTCEEVAEATRATTGCGSCTSTVQGLLDWLAAADAGSGGSQRADGGREGKVALAKQPSPEPETSGS
jgi:assimilatory nitrate reductase electron transfer subunit